MINQNLPLVDTNILYDFFTQSSDYILISNFLKKGFYLNNAVLFELTNLLNNKLGASFMLAQLDFLFKNNNIKFLKITDKNIQKASQICQKYNDQNLSLVDCILIAQAKEFNLELKTLDQRRGFCKEAKITKPY